jgi:hypothetical protein
MGTTVQYHCADVFGGEKSKFDEHRSLTIDHVRSISCASGITIQLSLEFERSKPLIAIATAVTGLPKYPLNTTRS